jgi:uncharacterized protein (DUF302 family)
MSKYVKIIVSSFLVMAFALGLVQLPVYSMDQSSEMPQMQMILEYESKYDFEETTQMLEEKVKSSGWSIVQIFDYKEILGSKGFDILNIKIYAVCSGKYSGAILELDNERMVSPLMPCRISIYEKSDGKTYIALMNSSEVAAPFGGLIAETMKAVGSETAEMIKSLVVSETTTVAKSDVETIKPYEGHLAWFALQTGTDGVQSYVATIKEKEANGIVLDDIIAADAFKMDYPFFFMEDQIQMILENESKFDFTDTVEKLKEQVEATGWSVVGEFDYKEILSTKGFDILDIKIIAVCSGKYSAEILSLDDERMVSPLMPCTIAVYEKSDGKTYIARLNSGEVAVPFGGVIAKVMQTVSMDTEAIIQELIK